MTLESILFALLRAAVCGEPVTDEVKAACTPEALEQVYILAAKHDLAHLPGHVLGNLGMPDSAPMQAMKQAAFGAVQRFVRLDYELGQICNAFEQAEIPFIPLKGAVIRNLYPEPWMRTSCDIDILIHKEDLARAASLLQKQLGYVQGENTPHDISLYAPGGIHLELHYDTIEETEIAQSRNVLSGIWEDARPVDGASCCGELSDALCYFYHIAHMAKHIQNGGCGIRPLMDLWILDYQPGIDWTKRQQLLKRGGLAKFASAARKLSEVWFSAATMDDGAEKLAQFILGAGVYGSVENRVVVGNMEKGGKLRYAVSRVFLPYSSLKQQYPIVEKRKILIPLAQGARWMQILFGGGLTRATRELRANAQTSSWQSKAVKELWEYLGL